MNNPRPEKERAYCSLTRNSPESTKSDHVQPRKQGENVVLVCLQWVIKQSWQVFPREREAVVTLGL